jgi:hypothetical protein
MKVKLGLAKGRTIRVAAIATVAVTSSATATITPGSVEQRVENLEAWRFEEKEDRVIAARFLATGFSLILLGELVDLVFC